MFVVAPSLVVALVEAFQIHRFVAQVEVFLLDHFVCPGVAFLFVRLVDLEEASRYVNLPG